MTTSDRNCLNQREGTILVDLLRPSPKDTNEEIAAAITKMFKNRHHNIESVEIYERPNKSKTKTLKFAKLVFNQQTIPEEICFSNTRIPIQEVFPRPMMCVKCLIFGHTVKRCKSDIRRCSRCSSTDHLKSECTSQLRCHNCGGSHDAFNHSCPHYVIRQEILMRMKRYGISWNQAKNDMKFEGKDIDMRPLSRIVAPIPSTNPPPILKPDNPQVNINQHISSNLPNISTLNTSRMTNKADSGLPISNSFSANRTPSEASTPQNPSQQTKILEKIRSSHSESSNLLLSNQFKSIANINTDDDLPSEVPTMMKKTEFKAARGY